MKYLLLMNTILSSFFTSDAITVMLSDASAKKSTIIVYLTGDGGMKPFSADLCKVWNTKGYDVVALNSKEYFNKRKTPQQLADDLSSYIEKILVGRKESKIVLVGFSFGANVLPYLETHLTKLIRDKVEFSVMISATKTTDFQTHYMDMLGIGKDDYEMLVYKELLKIKHPVFAFWGREEDPEYYKHYEMKNVVIEMVAGGHDPSDITPYAKHF